MGISASVGAILSSLASLSCCLPLGFAAAVGVGAASAFLTTLRPWFLVLAVALLAMLVATLLANYRLRVGARSTRRPRSA